ncbi:unnamed protein product [Rhizoctonia solani]|uniref:C2H2-type domain-containing protein n=1 Tax=Rhizoctonia solani TaxID=456999 RepID=A0A8H3HK76_9AGAM|nr:unnamed protein product [Rhizoctonia solani]
MSFECERYGCMFRARTRVRLACHMRTYHGVEIFFCTEDGCSAGLESRGELARHMRLHFPFACQVQDCGYSANTQDGLNSHVRQFHSYDATPYECDEENCNYMTKTASALARHMRVYHA